MRAATEGRVSSVVPGLLLTGIVAGVVFWIAYDNGTYGIPSRGTVAIALWWAIVVAVAFRLVAAWPLPRAALVSGGLLAALAAWTLASVVWSPSAEETVSELNRATAYLGLVALVVLVARRRDLDRWCDGLTAAIVGVALVALASRLFPGIFPDRGLATFLPSAVKRLSFPLGYWNGLGIFLALGLSLLLRLALVARSPLARGLAITPVPALAAALYLTSSRGGFATALVGAIAFLALTERRWSALAALVVASAGAAAAIAVLLARNELVNGPLGTEVVRSQGRSAAVLIAAACVAAAVSYGLGCRFLTGRIAPALWVGRTVLGVGALALVVAIAALDPVERFEVFKRLPGEAGTIDRGDFVRAHLLSGGGSGRWQFWSAAVDEWKEDPLRGVGAGSYEHWWAEHASFTYFVRDAHSLYLEALGELGIVGFVLVVALALTGIGAGTRRALRASGERRVSTAALTAVFTGYAFALGIDWMWELTAVSAIGLVALALLTGPPTEIVGRLRLTQAGESAPRLRRWAFGLGVVTLAVAWGVISAQAIQLLAQRAIVRSEDRVREGDLAEAEEEALVAREIQPWAASPYLQLALVEERQGDVPRAKASIEKAIDRTPRDWRLWLVAARIETKLGRVAAAERRLRRAAALNPRSPLFTGLLANGAPACESQRP